jgi:DNA-binding transcriptional ArsR family regulator
MNEESAERRARYGKAARPFVDRLIGTGGPSYQAEMASPSPYRRRVPRSHRRVMLVLLTDAGGLGSYTISRAAMTGSGTVYRVLNKLERAGWVTGRREGPAALATYRRLYRLTEEGRVRVLELLGLGPSPRVTE